MYRALAIFPKTADPAVAGELVDGAATTFKASAGCLRATRSIDAIMGPSARTGDFGLILEADFETLEDALAALQGEALAPTTAAIESLQPTLLLFECREV
jgi:hypothetical protein